MTGCVQPMRQVVRRWRVNGQQWALLECAHEEPNNDRPVAHYVRCTSCPPIPEQRTPEEVA